MKTIAKVVLPALAFLFVCSMGTFVAWISGTQPFTEPAGVIACSTLILACGVTGIIISELRK